MPCLLVHTNIDVADKASFLNTLSKTIAKALGKPEAYVMIELADNKSMIFAGSDAPLAFVALKSIGLTDKQTPALSATLCEFFQRQLGIDPARIYIEFTAPERPMFGWNGGTF